MTGRLFIAAELPQEMAVELERTARRLKQAVRARYSRTENYHITLAFLGETDLALVPKIAAALEGMPKNGAIPVSLGRLGHFGRENDAVLWCGLKGGQRLAALAGEVRAALEAEGIPFDRKPFRAHITLARRADIADAALDGFAPRETRGSISKVTLFLSEREKGVLVYRPLFTGQW